MGTDPQQNININQPLDQGFARWAEEYNEELEITEHDFRGEYYDITGKNPQWVSSGSKVMNEKGIRYVIGELRSLANKNTYLSNLEQDKTRLYNILISFSNTITDNLLDNAAEYDLDITAYDSIVERCTNIAEFALRRPLYGGERKFIKDTKSEVEVRTTKEGGVIEGVRSIFRGKNR